MSTGDFYFTDPIFGKMTLNANILRGNMHEMPELDNPGYSGVYRHNAKTGETTLGKVIIEHSKWLKKCLSQSVRLQIQRKTK